MMASGAKIIFSAAMSSDARDWGASARCSWHTWRFERETWGAGAPGRRQGHLPFVMASNADDREACERDGGVQRRDIFSWANFFAGGLVPSVPAHRQKSPHN